MPNSAIIISPNAPENNHRQIIYKNFSISPRYFLPSPGFFLQGHQVHKGCFYKIVQKAVAFFSVFIYDVRSIHKEAMDLSESERTTSVLDGLLIGDPISEHHGVQCCPAIRESTDERYIVKILSIPASAVQMDALLLTGAYSSPAHALTYFQKLSDEVLEEVDILRRLNAMEGFLPYTESEVRKKEDGSGYLVYLVSPYKRSLEKQMQLKPMTHLGAVNLGLDLCAALAICRRAGYLYIDLKPSNVFITPNQGYRISDLGFVSLSSLKYASYPEKYRSIYTAPEISDAMSSLNSRIDIYALGLILYQVYNNGELPTDAITAGATLQPPAYADYEIAEIILKACDPNPANRWADPLKMGQALVAYMQRNNINDTPIVPPPVVPEPEPVEEPVAADEAPEESSPDVPVSQDAQQEEVPEKEIPEEEIQAEETAAPEPETVTGDDPPEEEEAESEAVTVKAPVVPQLAPEEENSKVLGAMLESILEGNAPAGSRQEIPTQADQPEMDLSFIDDAPEDETAPTEESAADISEGMVSQEVQQMLDRADELISHELPEPAVAPEPIDVPFPAPIVLPAEPETCEEAPEETPEAENEESAEPEQIGDTTEEDSPAEASAEEVEEDDEEWDEEEDEYAVSEYYSDEHVLISKRSKNKSKLLITAFSCLALVIALLVSGTLFYRYYYVQTINNLSIDGSVDSLTAVIHSNIRDELLKVICTDTYGNTRYAEVISGRAHISNLDPNTQYRIQVNISGFHKLQGITTGSYTTAAQTEILNFTAAAGPEDGSVILSFTVNGPDVESWTLGYSTGNSQEQTQSFTGHTVTVNGLTIGSEYNFRLIPNEDQHLTGTWQLEYTAQQLVCAQELAIRSCSNGVLVAAWTVPEGSAEQSWNVRCYNGNGYDQTITTTDSQAKFTELDHAFGYTVEVTAVGMTQSATASVSANPITLSDISTSVSPDNANELVLNWNFTGEAPADGWILDYTIDGGAPITVSCAENSATVALYPGSKYEFDINPTGEITCYNKHLSYEAPAAAKFSRYGVSADDMSFYMCLTPEKTNWDRFDVPAPDYKTSYTTSERASFLVELWKSYEYSEDAVTITFIIRNEAGQPVSVNSVDSAWNLMWDKKFCELDIPEMPDTVGKYTVDILFNNQKVTTEAFEII